MSDHEDSAVWVRQLVAGDDHAVDEFLVTYQSSLERLAGSHMTPSLKQRVGPDDIVQSVCRTFVRRARKHEFQLEGSDSLWRLMCALTLTKVRQHARFHYRKRRSVQKESPLARGEGNELERIANSHEPTPSEIAEFTDELSRRFESLSEDEQALVQYKLEGFTQVEIAEKLNCSERTVRRLLDRVRKRWERDLDESLGE